MIRDIPAVKKQQMMEIDRLVVEKYGITLVQMMENAGCNLTRMAGHMLKGQGSVVVVCGPGNNGGGGMVAARHLYNHGFNVSAALAAESPESLSEVPALQWEILQKMGIPAAEKEDLKNADLVIDALFGYGINGNPRGIIASWIDAVNNADVNVLSLDIPSGLDPTDGTPGIPCICATATMTLALPKAGLFKPTAIAFTGDLYLADIGIPRELYRSQGIILDVLFKKDSLILLKHNDQYSFRVVFY